MTKTKLYTGRGNNNVWRNSNSARNNKDLQGFRDNYGDLGKIIKIEEPTYTTVYEVKDILDEEEKEWLRVVIKPFKENVRCVVKHNYGDEKESYIAIRYKEDLQSNFPVFKKGTMYKGMEVDKEYSLEDLGL